MVQRLEVAAEWQADFLRVRGMECLLRRPVSGDRQLPSEVPQPRAS